MTLSIHLSILVEVLLLLMIHLVHIIDVIVNLLQMHVLLPLLLGSLRILPVLLLRLLVRALLGGGDALLERARREAEVLLVLAQVARLGLQLLRLGLCAGRLVLGPPRLLAAGGD